MPNQPEYVTALQNAANAYMQGLQNREAREQRERERANEAAQQRKNFLLNLQAQQAQMGNVGAARALDTEFGQTPQVPEGFGSLLPKDQVTNPQTLNDAQRKLMGGINAMQGLPTSESPHYYEKHAAFTPDESQALQQGQRAFAQQNLAGLTGLSQGKSSPAFQGVFEQFAQQQQVKQQQALEQKQAETKRAQDEKYFEDVDRAVLDGRVSPANATKYFQAKRDYVSGRTTELPTVDFREKPENADARLQTARDRKTNTMLTAISRTDAAVAQANDDITKEFDRLNQITQQYSESGGTLPQLAGADFTKRINDLYKRRDQLQKQKESYNSVLAKLMAEEGLPIEDKKDTEMPSRADDVNRQEALKVFQRLLALGRDVEYARQESIKWFNFDPMTGEKVPSSYTPTQSNPAGAHGVAQQALQATEPQAGRQPQTVVSREDRTRAFLDQAGYESDDAAIKTFLQNNPNF